MIGMVRSPLSRRPSGQVLVLFRNRPTPQGIRTFDDESRRTPLTNPASGIRH